VGKSAVLADNLMLAFVAPRQGPRFSIGFF